jgi:hypothetical protein
MVGLYASPNLGQLKLEFTTNQFVNFKLYYMKKKRFSESQIVAGIKKQEAGISVKDICQEIGIKLKKLFSDK